LDKTGEVAFDGSVEPTFVLLTVELDALKVIFIELENVTNSFKQDLLFLLHSTFSKVHILYEYVLQILMGDI
jgi:hypothetical protein